MKHEAALLCRSDGILIQAKLVYISYGRRICVPVKGCYLYPWNSSARFFKMLIYVNVIFASIRIQARPKC